MEDLSKYRLESFIDPGWFNHYVSKMGEEKFWEYKNKVYKFLRSLKVGESIEVEKWCEPVNYDLFIKITCCFISESKGCYCFKSNYSIIKREFDAAEMERTITLLREIRERKNSGGDVAGAEAGQGRTSAVPAQVS